MLIEIVNSGLAVTSFVKVKSEFSVWRGISEDAKITIDDEETGLRLSMNKEEYERLKKTIMEVKE